MPVHRLGIGISCAMMSMALLLQGQRRSYSGRSAVTVVRYRKLIFFHKDIYVNYVREEGDWVPLSFAADFSLRLGYIEVARTPCISRRKKLS